MYQIRINRLRSQMKENDIFGVYVTSPENVFYFSGFTGFGDGRLLITGKSAFLITDSRYTVQAGEQCPDYRLISANAENITALLELIRNEELTAVGFENERILYKDFQSMQELCKEVRFVPMNDYFTKIRDQKDASELFYIRRACEIACKSLHEILDDIKPGRTELEIAAELEYHMKRNGASERSFETIVASGLRSAMPHGAASDKKLEYGDIVTIDFGCIYQHYCSDMTRTFFLGKPDARLAEIYQVVLEAQQAAIERYYSGITGRALDSISREIIKQHGYGAYFTHSLGHGVGIEIHEGASVSPRNDQPLLPQTVFSIEPGIYVENLGGVRIEDLVTEENGSLRILTDGFDKKILVL